MQLTSHFSYEELGIVGVEERIVANYLWLCENILEPLREHYNQAVHVHDGYRDPSHNNRVGGKAKSFHLANDDEAAVDIDIDTIAYSVLFDYIIRASGLPYDKVILEKSNGAPRCIHIQSHRIHTPERRAFIGGTGASTNYEEVFG